ncbi:DUF2232 domain-containing protein [Cohnella thailandensis]|uniref:DUF2232 domain-containing protein n=1 Tax=Cohnella thailandensis TaxID=557557 RepID=A0A841SSW5_9BACL|nr:DUF2232 domain-containing protein [Cohnella thailandensis]MBB6634069.1 DUF2232 domain-containing protein [Cohnella thailandensis]MBP1972439.1 uncharacterized protein YybS (DUF2232 family) [Cohnella thailandensis]
MKIGWKSVAWSAVALLVLLSIPTSLIVITLFLLMAPLVILYTMLKPLSFVAHVACIGIAAFALMGSYSLASLVFGLFFLIPAAVMGHLYKRRMPARTVVTVAMVVLLVQLLVELAIFSVQYDLNLSSELASLIEESLKQLQTDTLMPADWAAETSVTLGDAITKMLPVLLLLTSFMMAVVTHVLARRGLALMGIVIPGMTAMKNWMLPRSLVFYYLIALVLSYTISPESTGFWSTVTANAVPLLKFAFTIQAIAFFFFLADAKNWNKAVPVIIAIPLLIFPPFYLIGLLDTAFPIRKNFEKKG